MSPIALSPLSFNLDYFSVHSQAPIGALSNELLILFLCDGRDTNIYTGHLTGTHCCLVCHTKEW